jgi:uracil-DNA glycosylase
VNSPSLPGPHGLTPQAAHAALIAWWQLAGVEVDPALADLSAIEAAAARAAARERFAQAGQQAPVQPVAPARGASAPPRPVDALADARARAAAASSLEELAAAIAGFEGCALKRTARQTVVMDGVIGAPVLLVGEAPGREEDEQGKPFIGRSGQLLDRMLGSIGLSRSANLLITNSVYWRPPGNRPPSRDEIAICAPFVQRFVELAQPKLILLAGGAPAQALLGTSTGILKLRGKRLSVVVKGQPSPVLCFALMHPDHLLLAPSAKALAWQDLLRVQDDMNSVGLEPVAPVRAPS